MGGRKKLTNNTGIPQHRIEAIARCILPDVLAFYESEEGQREFDEWKKLRELEKQEFQAESGREKGRAHRDNGCVRLFLRLWNYCFFRRPLGLETGLRLTPLRK